MFCKGFIIGKTNLSLVHLFLCLSSILLFLLLVPCIITPVNWFLVDHLFSLAKLLWSNNTMCHLWLYLLLSLAVKSLGRLPVYNEFSLTLMRLLQCFIVIKRQWQFNTLVNLQLQKITSLGSTCFKLGIYGLC